MLFKASLTAGFFISRVKLIYSEIENNMKQIYRLTSIIFNELVSVTFGL